MTGASVIFPRFLGKDDNGDFVWELANGRWTWGDDPWQAAIRERTFAPDRYVEKYGAPQPIPGQGSPKQADAEPVSYGADALTAATAEAFEDGKARGAEQARKEVASLVLYSLLVNLDGWIEGAHENHEACDHRGESTESECWRTWAPADFRSMVNDVAREFGVAEFPRPEVPKEDSFR